MTLSRVNEFDVTLLITYVLLLLPVFAAVSPFMSPIVTESPLTRPLVLLVVMTMVLPTLVAPVIEPVGAVLQSSAPVTSLMPTSKKLVKPWLFSAQVTLMGTTTTLLAVKIGSP